MNLPFKTANGEKSKNLLAFGKNSVDISVK